MRKTRQLILFILLFAGLSCTEDTLPEIVVNTMAQTKYGSTAEKTDPIGGCIYSDDNLFVSEYGMEILFQNGREDVLKNIIIDSPLTKDGNLRYFKTIYPFESGQYGKLRAYAKNARGDIYYGGWEQFSIKRDYYW